MRLEDLIHLPDNECSSYVGMVVRDQDGTLSQDLTMNRRCRHSRVFSHELLHAIGLYHEQSRPDRDNYVAIDLKSVSPTRYINFRRIGTKSVNTRGLPYDYLSIMHYSSKAYSMNGTHTIIPRPDSKKEKYLNRIGRSRRLSQGDADVVNLMYGCSRHRPARPTCRDYPYRFP